MACYADANGEESGERYAYRGGSATSQSAEQHAEDVADSGYADAVERTDEGGFALAVLQVAEEGDEDAHDEADVSGGREGDQVRVQEHAGEEHLLGGRKAGREAASLILAGAEPRALK